MIYPRLVIEQMEDGSICLRVEFRQGGEPLSLEVAPGDRGQLEYCLLTPRANFGPGIVPVTIKEE